MRCFKSVYLKNFERYHEVELPLDTGGLIAIFGKTGHGKSSLFNGLAWCLFGVSFKDQRPDDVVNDEKGKDCITKVVIEDDEVGTYTIERYRKHKVHKNNLYFKLITPDGIEHDAGGWNNDATQVKIEEFLGMDVKLFTNSIMFVSGFSKFFATLGDTDQKTLIEAFVPDCDLYQEAQKLAKSDLKELESEISQIDFEKRHLEHEVESLESDLEGYRLEFNNFENNRTSEIEDLKNSFKEVKRKIKLLEEEKDIKLKELPKVEQELKRLKELKNKSICSKCKQSLPFEFQDDLIDLGNQQYDLDKSVSNIVIKLKYAYEKKDEIIQDIIKKEEDTNTYDKLINTTELKISKANSKLEDLDSKIEKLGLKKADIEFWITGFGPTGVKSFLFDSVIPSINEHLDYYSNILSEGMIQVKLCPTLKLKSGDTRDKFSILVVNPEGGKDYKSSSNGEKKVVNLSFLFAIQEIARERLPAAINIMLLDEALDSALDKDYEDAIFHILKGLAKDRTVFIISHKESLKFLVDRIYTVNKEKGVSKLYLT